MNYRYRVKGRVEKPFILRGLDFNIGGTIDTSILESELAFVKERCKLENISDSYSQSLSSQPIPTNSPIKSRGVKNELPKSTSRTNKSANTSKV